MFSGATEWALKRVARFLLRRHLGQLLRGDVDLESLDLALSSGTLALRSLLLNCDYINAQLGPGVGWEVVDAYIGSVSARVPITSLYVDPCEVELDEVLVTLRLLHDGSVPPVASGHTGDSSTAADADAGLGADAGTDSLGDLAAGAARVADGVQLIAGGLEALLQRLRVTAHRITVRVELPAPVAAAEAAVPAPLPGLSIVDAGILLYLSVGEVVYSGELPSATNEASARPGYDSDTVLQKKVSFSGLTVDLKRLASTPTAGTTADDDGRGGLSGVDHSRCEHLSGLSSCHRASYSMRCDGSSRGGNCGSTVISGKSGVGLTGRLQLHLVWPQPSSGNTTARSAPRAAAHLTLQPLCLQLRQLQLALVAEACQSFAATLSARQIPDEQLLLVLDDRVAEPEMQQSFFGNLMMPDFGGLVEATLAAAADKSTSSTSYTDVDSVFGTLRDGFAGTMAALSASVHGGGLPAALHPKPAEQVALQWELRSSIVGMSFVMWYPGDNEDDDVCNHPAIAKPHDSSHSHMSRCVLPEAPTSPVAASWGNRCLTGATNGEEAAAASSLRTASSSTSESYQTCGDATESFNSTLSGLHTSSLWAAQSLVNSDSMMGRDVAGSFASGTHDSHGSDAPWPPRYGDDTTTGLVQAAITAADVAARTYSPWPASGLPHEATKTATAALPAQDPSHSVAAVASSPGTLAHCNGQLLLECSDLILDASSIGSRTTVAARLYAVSAQEILPGLHSSNRGKTPVAFPDPPELLRALPPLANGESRPAPYLAPQDSAAAEHQPHVAPVVTCAGAGRSTGGRPSVSLRLRLERPPQAGTCCAPRQSKAGPIVEAAVRPVTLWLSMPLLERLERFAEPLLLMAAESTAAAAVQLLAEQEREAVRQQAEGAADSLYLSGSIAGDSFASSQRRNPHASASATADAVTSSLARFQQESLHHQPRHQAAFEAVRVTVAVAHVSAVVALPPAPSSSIASSPQSFTDHLALDFFTGPSHGQAVSPVVDLRCRPGVADRSARLEVDTSVHRVKAYLARSIDVSSSISSSKSGGTYRVSAHCILDAKALPDDQQAAAAFGSGARRRVAVEARAQWLPVAAADSSALPAAWEFAKHHAASRCVSDDDSLPGNRAAAAAAAAAADLDSITFRQQALLAAGTSLAISAPSIRADLTQADVATLLAAAQAAVVWRTVSAARAEAAGWPTVAVGPQTAVLLDIGLSAVLRPSEAQGIPSISRDAASFAVAASEVRALGVTCLSGNVDASAALLQVRGLVLRCGTSAEVHSRRTGPPDPCCPAGNSRSSNSSRRSSCRSAAGGSQHGSRSGRKTSAKAFGSQGGFGTPPIARERAPGSNHEHCSRVGFDSSWADRIQCGAVLLSCGQDSGIDILHISRPTSSACCEEIQGQESLLSVVLRGITFSSDPVPAGLIRLERHRAADSGGCCGPPSALWVLRLSELLSLAADDQLQAQPSASSEMPTLADAQPQAIIRSCCSINVEDCAVRLEPPPPKEGDCEATPVAAVLLVAGARWDSRPAATAICDGQQANPRALQDSSPPRSSAEDAIQPTEVVLASLSLWVADAEGRGRGWGATQAVDVPRTRLMDVSYSCVAQESRLSVAVSISDPGVDVAVTNRRLESTLTRGSIHKLSSLAQQWGGSTASVYPQPQKQPHTSVPTSAKTVPHSGTRSVAFSPSAACPANPAVDPGKDLRQEVRIDPGHMRKDDVQEYPQQYPESLETSVFLGGGWCREPVDYGHAGGATTHGTGQVHDPDYEAVSVSIDRLAAERADLVRDPTFGGSFCEGDGWECDQELCSSLVLTPPGNEPPGLIPSFLGTDSEPRKPPTKPPTDCTVTSQHSSPAVAMTSHTEGHVTGSDAVASDCNGEVVKWEERGFWYTLHNAAVDAEGSAPEMHEDHVLSPLDDDDEVGGRRGGSGVHAKGALAAPPPDTFPPYRSRFTLKEFQVLVALVADEDEAKGLHHWESQRSRPRSHPNQSPPTTTPCRVEVQLEKVSVRHEVYDEAQSHSWRLAVSIHDAEVRDCSVDPSHRSPWRRMLAAAATVRRPRDPRVPLFNAILAAAVLYEDQQPREVLDADVTILPLRVRLDQGTCLFLLGVVAPQSDESAVLLDLDDFADAAADVEQRSTAPPSVGGGPRFRSVRIATWGVTGDYKPRGVDVSALTSGAVVEVLNLVPWRAVSLQLPAIQLQDAGDLLDVCSSVASAYISDITAHQAHEFLAGVPPIAALLRLGRAAKPLAAIPRTRHGRSHKGNGASHQSNTVPCQLGFVASNGVATSGGTSRGASYHKSPTLERQLRRGLSSLARAIALEALGLSATVAGSAQNFLHGGDGSPGASHEQPAGLGEGLRQAGRQLQGGFGSAARQILLKPVASIRSGDASIGAAIAQGIRALPRSAVAPAEALAAAVRTVSLGTRNEMDPERLAQRRLDRGLP